MQLYSAFGQLSIVFIANAVSFVSDCRSEAEIASQLCCGIDDFFCLAEVGGGR